MVVGSEIDTRKLIRASSSLEELKKYSDGLVPKCLRHIKELIYNQRYYVAIELRNVKSLDFYKRNEMANKLIEDIYISGTFNEVVFISEVLAYADMDKVFKYIFKEELKDV